MKMNKRILGSVLAGTVLLGAAGAFASGGHQRMNDCERGGPMQRLEQVDGLSDAQRTEVEGIYTDQRETMRLQSEAMRANSDALREAMNNGADIETIQKLAVEQGAQVTAMIMLRAQMQEQLATVLNEDQMAQLQALRGDHWGRHGDGERRYVGGRQGYGSDD